MTNNSQAYYLKILSYLLPLLAAVLSFVFYGPQNPAFFNSDQAIHALMVLDFQWPQDAYYWGQDRLGSFMPLLALPIYQLSGVHPIYILATLSFSMLLASYFMLQRYVESYVGKLLLLLSFFFPHPTYIYQVLLGHPYAAQVFSVSVSVVCFVTLCDRLCSKPQIVQFMQYGYTFIFVLFGVLAVWISDLSLLLFPALLFYLLRLKVNGISYFQFVIKEHKAHLKLLAFALFLLLVGFLVLADLKHMAIKDASYQKVFFYSKTELMKQANNVLAQLENIVLLRKHHSVFQCLYYFGLGLLTLFVFKKSQGNKLLLLTLLLGLVLLFFSYWNLRANFDAKYFIPIHLGFIFWLAYQLRFYKIGQQVWLSLLLIVPLMGSNLDFIKSTRDAQNTFDMFSESTQIPDGILYGDYWDVYRVSAISKGRLYGVSMNPWDFRNKHKMAKIEGYDTWYLYQKNLEVQHLKPGDTLIVLDKIKLAPLGRTYTLHGDSLGLYKKLP